MAHLPPTPLGVCQVFVERDGSQAKALLDLPHGGLPKYVIAIHRWNGLRQPGVIHVIEIDAHG
jgi:hypothetical protein